MSMSEIDTAAGRLAGTTVTSSAGPVHAFLGIPFATADRFAAPRAVTPWTGTREATTFGPAAPQPIGGPLDGLVPGGFTGATDEHVCLTVNVWSPARSTPAPRPVLVWFPGGAFTIGASSQPVYDGARFCAEQDVVLVTCNYRLGALGFLDTRSSGGAANCGLRDTIAALEWVRENIEAFGGDPTRVVAFGESAGGGVVLHLCTSPLARGLLRGAVVQSGATFNTLDHDRAATVRDTLIAELDLTDAKLLADVPIEEMLRAQVAAGSALLGTIGMMPFHPMVDGEVLPATPVDALQSGAAAGIPLVIGTTTDEMRLFLDLTEPLTRERLCARVARTVGVEATRASRIVTTYERALATPYSNEIWAALFSDVQMQVPADAMRTAHAAHGPTYSYLFGWPATDPRLGACHGIDIPFTFGNYVDGWAEFVGADDGTDEADRVGFALRSAWARLARDGSPGWPEAPATMVFDRAMTVADDPLRARLASIAQ